MKFEAGQGVLGRIRFADGAYPKYARTYLIVEATSEYIVVLNISSVRGKEWKLAYHSNEKLRLYKPPFLKPSFAKLDSATKLSASNCQNLTLLAQGKKLQERELIRIQSLLQSWQEKNNK